MNKYLVLFVIATLGMTGCKLHSTKDWVTSGGSRSEALVELSYEYDLLESPVANSQQGLELAKSNCLAWGYAFAKPFGTVTGKCVNKNCTRMRVTSKYWCSSINDFVVKIPRVTGSPPIQSDVD